MHNLSNKFENFKKECSNIKNTKILKPLQRRRIPANILNNRRVNSRNQNLAFKSNPIRSPKAKADMKFSIINNKKKQYRYVRMQT